MKIHNVEQGSEEWHRLRLGIPTTSRFSDVITPAKGGRSASLDGYAAELAGEWYLGRINEQLSTEDILRGSESEPFARSSYEFITGCEVEQIGFATTDDGKAGCSPDGLIGTNGGLEIKAPNNKNHLLYMTLPNCPDKYKPQIQGCMWIMERDWWDFMSYNAEFPPHIVRVYRDDAFIRNLAKYVYECIEKVEEIKSKLEG